MLCPLQHGGPSATLAVGLSAAILDGGGELTPGTDEEATT